MCKHEDAFFAPQKLEGTKNRKGFYAVSCPGGDETLLRKGRLCTCCRGFQPQGSATNNLLLPLLISYF